MSVANLTRYKCQPAYLGDDGQWKHNVDSNGEFVKFEEAVEASSNSLQQLKAEIAALVKKLADVEKFTSTNSEIAPCQHEYGKTTPARCRGTVCRNCEHNVRHFKYIQSRG